MWDSRLRLRSEFVTFSKLPKIDAANKAVTTTKSSKIQKSHELSGPALRCPVEAKFDCLHWPRLGCGDLIN
jgi:hypothetical protein